MTTLLEPDRLPFPRRSSTGSRTGLELVGLVTVLLGAFLGTVDFFIVNVALPAIEADLHASGATLQLLVSGYGIAYALLLVLGGRLGDQFGRRRMFLIGMAAFTLTRVICGFAPTAGLLVAARIVQGASAALMVPQVLATIQTTTTGPRRTRAVAAYAATAGVAMVVGQLVGGALVSADIWGVGWRSIFFVTLPLGIAGLVLGRLVLPESRSDAPARIDASGTGLLAATLLAVLIPLTEGRAFGWPAWAFLMLASAPVFAAAFVAVEVRGERAGRFPLVPPSLLRAPSMRLGLALAVPFFCGFGGFMFVFPVAIQQGEHFGAFHAGIVLAPYALSFFAVSLVVGRLVARYGSRVIAAGLLVEAVGIVGVIGMVWAYWPHAGLVALLLPSVVAGSGQAAVMAPLFGVVLAEVPADRSGTGSGVLNTTMQTSLALGVAVLGTVFLALVPALGMRDAFAVALGCELVALLSAAVVAPRLPNLAA